MHSALAFMEGFVHVNASDVQQAQEESKGCDDDGPLDHYVSHRGEQRYQTHECGDAGGNPLLDDVAHLCHRASRKILQVLPKP